MNRIPFDPAVLQCPDYTSEAYTPARAPFVNDNTTNEQAIQLLINVWTTGNNLERLQWQEQRQNDLAIKADEILHKQEAAEQRARTLAQEQDALRKDELKRNKTKYIPIPNRPMPTIIPVFASNYATKKMDKGHYLELWYYTNEGLDDAMRTNNTMDEDAMIISRNHNGSTSWVSAAASQNSSKVINDKDVPWEDFCQAVPRMILAMEEAGWPPERVHMLATFWGNLQVHKLRSSHDPLDQKALLLYQARQCRLWHLAIPSPQGAYDISIIDEQVMRKTKEEVYWEDRKTRDNERDFCVSLFPRPLLASPTDRFPPATHHFLPTQSNILLHTHATSLPHASPTLASCMLLFLLHACHASPPPPLLHRACHNPSFCLTHATKFCLTHAPTLYATYPNTT